MGKKEGKRKILAGKTNSRPRTIREEITGKRESNVKGLNDVNGVLRLKHLQNIATWASGEAKSPSLGAYFGYQLAASREALGIKSNDVSLVSCQRCEALLQPGSNCIVRIEKNAHKGRQKKRVASAQNNVVYTCLFCSHRNLKPGTVKGHLKKLAALAPRPKFITKETKNSTSVSKVPFQRNMASMDGNSVSVFPVKVIVSANEDGDSGSSRMDSRVVNSEERKADVTRSVSSMRSGQATLLLREQVQQLEASTGIGRVPGLLRAEANSLSEADGSNKEADPSKVSLIGTEATPLGRTIDNSSIKRRSRKKKSSSNALVEPATLNQECGSEASSRRKRKSSWSSLKELTHEEQNKRHQYGHLSDIAIPFSL